MAKIRKRGRGRRMNIAHNSRVSINGIKYEGKQEKNKIWRGRKNDGEVKKKMSFYDSVDR